MVEDMGVATGIDLDAMIAAAAEAEGIVGRELPSQVLRAGPRTRLAAPRCLGRIGRPRSRDGSRLTAASKSAHGMPAAADGLRCV